MKTRLLCFMCILGLSAFAGYHNSNGYSNKATSEKRTNEMKSWESNQQAFSMNEIKTAQEALKMEGFNVGTVDGFIGPKTKNAIMQYQASNDLKETGNLNAETMDSLNSKVETSTLSE